MIESLQTTVPGILVRLLAAGLIGGLIGFERRAHHKAIGIAAHRNRQHNLYAAGQATLSV
jgi:uncharacterized membrane protein YhiD involved in acid resistance